MYVCIHLAHIHTNTHLAYALFSRVYTYKMSICIYMYMCIHAYTYKMSICIYMYMCIHVNVCVYLYTHLAYALFSHLYTYKMSICIYMYMCIHAYTYKMSICIYMYMCIHVNVCVYLYTHLAYAHFG